MTCPFGLNPNRGFVARRSLFAFYVNRIKSIGNQVKDYPADVLGKNVDFPNFRVKTGLHQGIKRFILSPQAMKGQSEIFICYAIYVGWLFDARTALAVLKHALYNGIGTLAMMVDLVKIVLHIIKNFFCQLIVATHQFLLNLRNQFPAHLRKIIHEIQRILYFM